MRKSQRKDSDRRDRTDRTERPGYGDRRGGAGRPDAARRRRARRACAGAGVGPAPARRDSGSRPWPVFDRAAVGLGEANASTSAGAWLATAYSNQDHARASAQVRTARRLERMPLVAMALAEGRISAEHARALADAADVPEFPEAEAVLVQHASELRPAATRRVVEHWRGGRRARGGPSAAGPPPAPPRHAARRHARARWPARPGRRRDPSSAALDDLMERSSDCPGEPSRSRSQRRADAVVDLCDRYLRGATRSRKPQAPAPGRRRLRHPRTARGQVGAASTPASASTPMRCAGWRATPRCPASLTDPEGLPLYVSAARPGSFRPPSGVRSTCATPGAPSRAATARPTGATPTTSGTGPTVARRDSTTSPSSVGGTTRCSTSTACGWSPARVGGRGGDACRRRRAARAAPTTAGSRRIPTT